MKKESSFILPVTVFGETFNVSVTYQDGVQGYPFYRAVWPTNQRVYIFYLKEQEKEIAFYELPFPRRQEIAQAIAKALSWKLYNL